MSNKTRVLNVRVVGFSAPERQMLNSIFLLSVAPARQIGYKLWNPETGVAPDMYLLDGDSDSAVASWQATFSSTSDRTLVVGSKNTNLGVAAAARPLGLKVVGAMDRLAIALNNVAAESNKPKVDKHDVSLPRITTGMPAQQPTMSSSLNGPISLAQHAATAAGSTLSSAAAAATHATTHAATHVATHAGGALSSAAAAIAAPMTSAAPATTVLPHVTLQPNIAMDKALNEKPLTDRTVDRILNDKPEKTFEAAPEKAVEKPAEKPVIAPTSGATPLSPSALAAAVAPSATRTNLRVVQLPSSSPLAASLPAAPAPVVVAPVAPATVAVPPVVMPPAAVAPPVVAAPVPVVAPPAAPVVATPVTPLVPVAPVHTHTPRHEEHNFRVLAVDDSPLMRTFLQNKLQPYGIYPEFAASGEEALFKISKQHFDLIFLDVLLPGMDGYDVCKAIKKNKDNSLMKVVMLTSKDRTFDKIRGTMAGCDGYLTKPVDEIKLRAIIERHTVTRK